MSLCYPIEMAFYCLCILLFFHFGSSLIFTFFCPPSEIIRCGVTKGPDTEANTNQWRNWDECHFVIPYSWHFIVYVYYYYLLIIFNISLLLVLFYFSSLSLVFLILFLCLIALLDWFSSFSLYCILIVLLSLHPCSNNTQLLIGYFMFWLSKSYISCHIIVVPVLL